MRFVDQASIIVESGNGGAGCVSFRREKFVPNGGPDGGDGGKGGDVVFKTSLQKRTLYQFRTKKFLRAERGGYGQGRQRHGKNGKSIIIEIPKGTVVSNVQTGAIIKDFTEEGEVFVVAKGGRGGQGNKRFTTSTNRAPRFAQPGEPGEVFELKLELKLIADVGITGFPNAGKSTLISVISSLKPKIANYPFTTLIPNIGMVQHDFGEPFAVADIPGLIEGAHTGLGLGIEFLRHVERTKVLVHLIDVFEIDENNPLKSYNAINYELEKYSKKLILKPQIVVLNKIDLPDTEKLIKAFKSAVNIEDVVLISAVTGKGINKLKQKIAGLLESFHEK